MNRRLKKLIEEKAWETLTDYGYNDSQLLEQLTQKVLVKLSEQKTVINEQDAEYPIPAGAPAGGDFFVDPVTGRLLYTVIVNGQRVIYEMDGEVSDITAPTDPFDFSLWFNSRYRMARNAKRRKDLEPSRVDPRLVPLRVYNPKVDPEVDPGVPESPFPNVVPQTNPVGTPQNPLNY